MHPSQSPPLEDLLAQVGWIRALSKSLVRDPDLADEVVQQTLVRASLEGPREAGSMRAWLRAVVRNFARASLRSRARRKHHEQNAARSEREPSAHDVLERAAMQRELVQCVMDLDEPYRTTILLRFFEDHSPRQIAARLGVPAATVRTRLARGLALLRARLDRQHGGGRANWAVLLLPLRSASSAPLAPLLAMNLKAALAACALCTAGLVLYFVIPDLPAPQGPRAMELGAGASTATLAELQDAAQADARRIAPSVGVEQTPELFAPAPQQADSLQGSVVDADSQPVAQAKISFAAASGETPQAVATSDAAGEFALERPTRAGQLRVEDETWVTLFAGLVGSMADQRRCTIVVARNAALEGVVVDDLGVALPGVELEVRPTFGLRARFADGHLDASEALSWTQTSDGSGRFSFTKLPRCEGLRWEASLPGHVPYGAALLDSDRPFKTITLTRTLAGDEVLRGRVLDAGEQPVVGAAVALGLETTISDDRGEFALSKSAIDGPRSKGTPIEVRALAPGKLPASYSPPIVDGRPNWPESVTLRLGGPTLEIAGRILRADDTPVGGARVWLADSTTFGDGPGGTLQLEGWLAGDDQNAWHFVSSDEHGAFILSGLLEREYTLHAIDPRTLERAALEHVAAGSRDVTLVMLADATMARVAGVAVDSAGEPIPDVRVVPNAVTFMARHAGHNLFSTSVTLEGTLTDAQGRFVLEHLPREGVELNFSGDGVLNKGISVSALEGEAATSLRVELERRMQLQVELADPDSADAYALLDAGGAEISLILRAGSTTYFMQRPPILEGRSHVASGSERARTLVTYKGGKEVGRTSVRLSAAQLTVVRL